MRRARRSAAADGRHGPEAGSAVAELPERWCRDDALESLVLAVAALDGERAAELLDGLAGELRTGARVIVRGLQWTSPGRRHAALERAFACRTTALAQREEIPGALGASVRALHGQGEVAGSPRRPEPMERWARRLVLEAGVSGGSEWCTLAPSGDTPRSTP
jgi:hypothetical protein